MSLTLTHWTGLKSFVNAALTVHDNFKKIPVLLPPWEWSLTSKTTLQVLLKKPLGTSITFVRVLRGNHKCPLLRTSDQAAYGKTCGELKVQEVQRDLGKRKVSPQTELTDPYQPSVTSK